MTDEYEPPRLTQDEFESWLRLSRKLHRRLGYDRAKACAASFHLNEGFVVESGRVTCGGCGGEIDINDPELVKAWSDQGIEIG